MSLGFRFNLTPSQTRVLLIVAFDHRTNIGSPDHPLRLSGPDFFIMSAKSLVDKGLVDHDNNRDPTWTATKNGAALAHLIADEARKLAALSEGAEDRAKLWVPKFPKKNKHGGHWPRYTEAEWAKMQEPSRAK